MKKVLFYILIINRLFVLAQDKNKTDFPQFVEIQTGYGFIAQHTNILGYYITGHIPNININVGKKVSGNKEWHKLYCYPEIGLGYYFAYLNNDYLGTVHALYSYVNLPFNNKKSKLKPYFNTSIGVSYLPKPFDIIDNYQNRVIGTHFNVYFKSGFGIKYQISDKLELNSILGVNHYSNAKIRTPNLGINVININLGLKYNIKPSEIIEKDYEKVEKNKNELLLIYAGGIKATPKPMNKRYYASAFIIDYYRTISPKSKFGIGTDLFYDGTQEYYYNKDSIENNSKFDYLLSGLHLSYGFVFNRVSFNFQVGYYLYDKLNINGEIYSRVGFRTYISDRILLNLTLKTHFAKADLLEIGVGYRIL